MWATNLLQPAKEQVQHSTRSNNAIIPHHRLQINLIGHIENRSINIIRQHCICSSVSFIYIYIIHYYMYVLDINGTLSILQPIQCVFQFITNFMVISDLSTSHVCITTAFFKTFAIWIKGSPMGTGIIFKCLSYFLANYTQIILTPLASSTHIFILLFQRRRFSAYLSFNSSVGMLGNHMGLKI